MPPKTERKMQIQVLRDNIFRRNSSQNIITAKSARAVCGYLDAALRGHRHRICN